MPYLHPLGPYLNSTVIIWTAPLPDQAWLQAHPFEEDLFYLLVQETEVHILCIVLSLFFLLISGTSLPLLQKSVKLFELLESNNCIISSIKLSVNI